MAKRPTSQWVPIERLVPHPENANELSAERMEKLKANIDETGNMPPIICRSLEASDEYGELLEQDKLQILDGEHRWKLAKERGAKEVEVRIWPNVSDDRARVLLLTLNRLTGEDNKAKRNALIRRLIEADDDVEALSAVLPETQETLTKTMSETTRAAVENATQRAAEIGRQEPFTVFVLPEQAAAVRQGIKTWLDVNDPERMITDCREGAALAGVCGAYVDSS
jgi:ParB-like chromosome segregation protein Spo0J